MNKKLFWSGLAFQILQLSALGIIFLSNLDWSFMTKDFFIGVIFVILNIVSLGFMLIGALKDDK